MDELGFNHFIPILDETVKGFTFHIFQMISVKILLGFKEILHPCDSTKTYIQKKKMHEKEYSVVVFSFINFFSLVFKYLCPILGVEIGHRQEKRSAKAQGGTSKKQKKDKITENSAVSQAETEAHSQEISQDLPGIVPSTLITNKETFAVVDHSSQDALN